MSKSKNRRNPRQRRRGPVIPIVLALGGLLLVGLAAASLLRSREKPADLIPAVSGGPSLQVDQEKIDLGDVPLGTPVRAQFTLTNSGDRPLQLTEDPYIEVVEGC
jgi:hypothetical protein